jgi:hypothetical protein
MAILLNITVFWGVTPYSLVATVQILEWAFSLHLQEEIQTDTTQGMGVT